LPSQIHASTSASTEKGLLALPKTGRQVHTHSEQYLPAYPISTVDQNVVSRTGAIGDAPKGPNDYFALEYYKQLVPNAEVTLPGSTCATCDPTTISPANTWTPQDLALLVENSVERSHSQSGIMGHHLVRILKERGHLDMLKGLITIEGSCSLSNSGLKAEDFDNIPYRALKGDYTPTSEVCQNTVDALNIRRAAGQGIAKADYIKLGELGNPIFNGTTHMMMLGTNNLEVADGHSKVGRCEYPAAEPERQEQRTDFIALKKELENFFKGQQDPRAKPPTDYPGRSSAKPISISLTSRYNRLLPPPTT
jgi:hypothetical protein